MEKEISWLLKEKYFGSLPAGRQDQKKFEKDVERLKAGEPLDYVIGFTEFLGCKIDLSKRPLIPRAETEFWVEEAIEQIKNSKNKKIKVLDIFSGSGCIGVAVIKNLLPARRSLGGGGCDFSDVDSNNLKQIKINLKLNKIKSGRYKVIQSDIFKNIKNKYDFIFANPPYIPINNKNRVQESVLKYEPNIALFGGKDGLYFIRKFLRQAKKYLNSGGVIFMEFDFIQKKEIEGFIKKCGYESYKFHKDQYGKWRWVMVK